MKKFIKQLLLFLPVAVIVYIFYLFVWGFFSPKWLQPNIHYKLGAYGHLHSRIKEIKDYKNVDILFLGSSHAYRGFDTRIFTKNGLQTFNLGSSSQSPLQSQLLLKRYLPKLNPKVVVFEVYPNIFRVDGVESSLDIIANDVIDVETLKMALKINKITTYNTLLFGTIMQHFDVSKNFKEPKTNGVDSYISGGYVASKIQYFTPANIPKKSFYFQDYQLEAFKEIANDLKDKNILLLFVYAPVTQAEYQSFDNMHLYTTTLQSMGELYDFNQFTKFIDTIHFYDSHHLNQKGVEEFNLQLIQILKSKHL
jgi:hypothetical protein